MNSSPAKNYYWAFLALLLVAIVGYNVHNGHTGNTSASTASVAAVAATATPVVLAPAVSQPTPSAVAAVAPAAAATPVGTTASEVQTAMALAQADILSAATSCFSTGGSVSSPACRKDMAALKSDAGLARDDIVNMPVNPGWEMFANYATAAMADYAAAGEVCPAGPSHDAAQCLTFLTTAQARMTDALAARPD